MTQRKWWLLSALVGAWSMVGAVGVLAQAEPARIVQAGDGTLYLLKDGARYAIAADAVGDDELAAYADGGTLASADLVSVLGAAPARQAAVVPSEVAAPAASDNVAAPAAGDNVAAPAAGDTAAAPAPAQPSRGAAKTSASGQPPAGSNPREGQTIQFVSVRGGEPGATAQVTLLAAQGQTCTLAYTTPAGTRSTAAGLGQQTVAASGTVTWSFPIDSNTQRGLGTVIATCGNLSVSNTIQIGGYGLSR